MVSERKAVSTRPRRRARRLLRAFLFGLLLLLVAALSLLAGFYVAIDRGLPSLQIDAAQGVSQTTHIYDDADPPTLLAELHGVENRQILTGEQIPQIMRDAVVAIEDERFYLHKGVDFLGILRAAWANLRSRQIEQGGSTITQQYIKNALISDEQTLDRKVREATLAYQLEKQWSKEKILNEYLNIIYFGEGAYGIEAAAREYYGVSAIDLSPAQAALLAGLPQAPSAYSPRRDAGKAMARRDLVLNKMYQQGYITAGQLQEALDTPLALVKKDDARGGEFPYWTEMVREQLVARYGSSTVLEGGLKVYVSMDVDLQRQAEKAVSSVLDQAGDPAAALVSIDVRTGRLLAMVAGSDFSQLQFNLATQGRRQPGSAFKPLVLVTALDQGISPDALYESGPVTVELPGEDWDVSSKDEGAISLRRATAWSSNGVYARLIMEVGADAVAQTAYTMGIQTTLGDDPNPAIALGGLHEGVSVMEMALAYATLAAEGESLSSSVDFSGDGLASPVIIVRVVDAEGRILDQNEAVRTGALDPALAAVATSCLEAVISDGTGTAAAIGRPAAGKTGTTSDYRDAWFVGYTPEIVTAVWVGYPTEQKGMTDVHGGKVTGGSLPAQIWAAYMDHAAARLPVTQFARAETGDWVTVEVCSESRLLPTEHCPHVVEAVFAADGRPTETCPLHTAPEVVMPDVVDLPLVEARAIVEDLGLAVSVAEVESSGRSAGTVVGQEPQVGAEVAEGATVVLLVSVGETLVETPQLEGLDIDLAGAILAELGLRAEATEVTDDSSAGTVIGQSEPPGTILEPGGTVRIVVSAGPAVDPDSAAESDEKEPSTSF